MNKKSFEPDELFELMDSVGNLRDRAFFSTLYLSGARVGEIVGQPITQTIKYLDKKKSHNGKKVYSTREQLMSVGALRKDQLYFFDGKRSGVRKQVLRAKKGVKYPYFLFKDLYTEKRRETVLRSVPVSMKKEGHFVKLILDYLPVSPDVMFDFTRKNGYYLVKKHFGFNPHHFRHLRLTHWKLIYGLDAMELTRMTQWADTRMANTYVSMDAYDLIPKL